MINFETLTIRNFLSFGNVPTTFQLNVPGTTLILGESLDDTSSGNVANGCGKTTIINALVYAVYDKPISNISKDNLVNNINKKNMEVVVSFTKNKTQYIIKRFRKTKSGAAGNYAQLFENNKEITPDSVNHTNDLIEKIIGIPYELFVRIIAFPAMLTPFLNLPLRSHYTANQTSIIEELFNLKILSEKALILKDHIKDTEQKVNTVLAKEESLNREKERHNTQILKAKKRVIQWENNSKQEIKEIEDKLNKIQCVDISKERKLHDKLKKIQHNIKSIHDDINNFQKNIEKYNKLNTKTEKELKHLQNEECPYCHQSFKDTETNIKKCIEFLKNNKKTITELKQKLQRRNNRIEKLQQSETEILNNITVQDIDNLIEIKNKAKSYKERLIYLTNAKNPHLESLEELEDINLVNSYSEQINNLKDKINHQKFLLKLLTKRDSFIRKALLNKNIPFLNQRLSYYLTSLGLQHTVEFTHEMTAQITQFGKVLDFGNLSNGQQARVNLALSFAFRDVLQSLHEHINVCMLDEVLDVGLDTVGVRSAARMLKTKARNENISLYIISHRDEIDSAFDQKLIVQMSNGFSSLRYEN